MLQTESKTTVVMSPVQGRVRTEENKIRDEDRPIHDWYRFVLSYPPHFVRRYVNRFELNEHHCVLDPFCGTGTTIVECQKIGIPSIGTEITPMGYFASRTKIDWNTDPVGLVGHAEEIAEAALRDGQLLRTLEPEKMKLLLSGSISPLPLHKTLVLLDCMQSHYDKRYYDHERLALAKVLVSSVGNLHFGPEVGVGKPKLDANVIGLWLAQIRTMARDIDGMSNRTKISSAVHCCDSRVLTDVLKPSSVDAVITSPPYPNEKDYTRTTRLESVILGFINDKSELRALKHKLVRSNTRGVYKEDNDDLWICQHPEIHQIADAIEARRVELGKTSGFERLYSRVTKLYFGGMARHLEDLRIVLRPGARLAYVVGDQASYLRVMIRTGQILARIAESLGYEVMGIDLFRTRLATKTKEQLREEVLLLRWPG
ncbi:MAG: DNA methyltransferase [Armatimonadota bacterium]